MFNVKLLMKDREWVINSKKESLLDKILDKEFKKRKIVSDNDKFLFFTKLYGSLNEKTIHGVDEFFSDIEFTERKTNIRINISFSSKRQFKYLLEEVN